MKTIKIKSGTKRLIMNKKYRFSSFKKISIKLNKSEYKEIVNFILNFSFKNFKSNNNKIMDYIKKSNKYSELKNRYARRFGEEQLQRKINIDTYYHLVLELGYRPNFMIDLFGNNEMIQ